jgi:hypothetical protein
MTHACLCRAAGKPTAAGGTTAKVNCWRAQPSGRRAIDPKATILDQVISRFGTAEQVGVQLRKARFMGRF